MNRPKIFAKLPSMREIRRKLGLHWKRPALALAIMAGVLSGMLDPLTAMAAGAALTVETVAGSTMWVTTVAPATYDAAGYGSSAMNWTVVGELTDLGQGYGKQFNIVTHAPIASAQQQQKKGSYTLAAIDCMCGWDQSDTGQDILRANADTYTTISIRIVKQNGDVRYFTAQVSKFVENQGTVDNIVMGAFTLLPQTPVVPYPS